MPHFDIIRAAQPGESFRVKSVMGTYDLQTNKTTEHFVGDIDLPDEWNVGLIVGRSGTGKTTIARELFGDCIIDGYEYTHESILDDMPKEASVAEITAALSSVGFASPPSWLKSYAMLSNGEKMRCDLARAMLEKRDVFCFDEFTSVVDRTVAKIGSFAIQKAIRRGGKKFIAVTCHADVEEWLMPDWVFNTDTMTFSVKDLAEQKKKSARHPAGHRSIGQRRRRNKTPRLGGISQVSLFECNVQRRGNYVFVLCQWNPRRNVVVLTVPAPEEKEHETPTSYGRVPGLSRYRGGEGPHRSSRPFDTQRRI